MSDYEMSVYGETLKDLLREGKARDVTAVQMGERFWTITAQAFGTTVVVGSKREQVRRWATIDAVARYARERFGIVDMQVKGLAVGTT